MFDQKGQIIVDKEECELDADDLMMQALDAGAEDFSEEEDSFEILTDPNDFSEVRLALEEAGIPMGKRRSYNDSTDMGNFGQRRRYQEHSEDA